MTIGPTATQLHQRTLTEEEEPRTTAIVPATGPSSSANACEHEWVVLSFDAQTYERVYCCVRCRAYQQPAAPPLNPTDCWSHTYTPVALGSNAYACIKCGEPLE